MVVKLSIPSTVTACVIPHEVLWKILVEFVCVTQRTLLFSVIRVGYHPEQILDTFDDW